MGCRGGGSSFFSTKHGRPPRPSRDRFFPRTIYSFTFYSHRAFDNSWMAEDKLVSTLADHLSPPFRSGCGGVVGWRMFLEKRLVVLRALSLGFLRVFRFAVSWQISSSFFFLEYWIIFWILFPKRVSIGFLFFSSFNYFFSKTIFIKEKKKRLKN